MKKTALILSTVLLFLSCKNNGNPERFDLLITNVNIIDVANNETIENSFVAILNDSIAQVGKMNDLTIEANGNKINARGNYLLPGLWDMHVHFRGGDSLIDENRDLLKLYLAYGVTTVRDAGGDISGTVLEWKKQISNELLAGPDIYTSGPKLDGANPAWEGSIKVNTEEDINWALDSLESIGADYVKMYDGSLNPEIFYGIIEEAEKRNLKTTGHMPLKADFTTAIEYGLDGIEHMYYTVKTSSPLADSLARTDLNYGMVPLLVDSYDEELANEVFSKMAREGISITPTLFIGKTLAELAETDHSRDSLLNYIGNGIKKTYRERLERARKAKASGNDMRKKMGELSRSMIVPMYKAGVNILAGSDAGAFNSFVYPGESLHAELEALVAAGLSPKQALETSIINGPQFFGMEGDYGSLREGMPADLIILRGNPLEDIKNTRSIKFVIKDGKVHAPGELLKSLK